MAPLAMHNTALALKARNARCVAGGAICAIFCDVRFTFFSTFFTPDIDQMSELLLATASTVAAQALTPLIFFVKS
jgi:hypothetical protein